MFECFKRRGSKFDLEEVDHFACIPIHPQLLVLLNWVQSAAASRPRSKVIGALAPLGEQRASEPAGVAGCLCRVHCEFKGEGAAAAARAACLLELDNVRKDQDERIITTGREGGEPN